MKNKTVVFVVYDQKKKGGWLVESVFSFVHINNETNTMFKGADFGDKADFIGFFFAGEQPNNQHILLIVRFLVLKPCCTTSTKNIKKNK
jgi:hypothetical protein